MYIDFHTHGKLTKKLPFSTIYTDWLFSDAKHAGLDALCLTEHFNTLHFDELYNYIVSVSDREGDCLVLENGLRIFPGMETDIMEGGHILSIGPVEAILEINARLESYKEKGNFLPFKELMEVFSEYPLLVGAAHPYRHGGHIPELPIDELKKFHFLDLNGKDVAEDRMTTERRTYALGEALGIPVVGGSDTHQAVQYGCIKNNFSNDITTFSKLYEDMKSYKYKIEIAPEASFQVKTATLLKRSLKEIHGLGGDYVSVLLGESKNFNI